MIKKSMMFFGIIIVLFFHSTTTFALEMPKNSLDCIKDEDCLEEMHQTNNPATDAKDEPNIPTDEAGSLGFSLFKMVFTLLIILGLIYVLLKFLKKRSNLFNNMQAMENLGGISVGQNKSIQIVRIGPKIYIIGVGENVEMLEEITDQDLIEDLLHRESKDTQTTGRFTSFLTSKLNVKQAHEEKESNDNFASLFSNELENLKHNREKVKRQHKQKEDHYE